MKRIIAILLCAAMLAGLTGCGNGGEEDYTPTGNALVMEGQDPDSVGPTEPEERQEVTMAYYPNRSLNPLKCSDFTNRAVLSLIYQGLFTVDNHYKVYPMLCENYRIAPNNKSYTIYITPDATFSDGSRLTIEDVFATYQYALESGYYGERFTHVSSIALTEDGGIIFYLDTPMQNFTLLLDVPILKASEIEAARPLGTGPYVLEDTLNGAHLRKLENWWCNADLPITAAAIPLVVAEDPTQIRDEFEFYDVSLVCANPYSDKYADFRGDFELWECDNGIMLYLCCNVAYSEIFTPLTIRTALTYAIDREGLVEKNYHGMANPSTLACSPLSPYYSETLAQQYAYDPVRFVNALAEFGPITEPVELLVNSDDSLRVRTARDIAATLTELGLPTVTVEKSTTDFLNAIYYGHYDLYLGQTMLSANMDLSAFYSPIGNMSRNGMADPEIYALCLDALENNGNYYNLMKVVADDSSIIPILFSGYLIYAERGLLSDLTPARDNLICYDRGWTMEDALLPVIYDDE